MAEPDPRPSIDVRREPERARYDRATIDAILDEAFYCHLGFVHEGHPVVIPTIHVRVGDRIVLHGSPAGRMMRLLASGAGVSIAATLFDGLVLARSVFHHSMNYRSVVLFGRGEVVQSGCEVRLRVRGDGDGTTDASPIHEEATTLAA
ncbi:MAG: pyridoxamine 5'-phosphate oxidase family protein [Actinobacteria bacterium]|nr:pyridoxamine 5'-phosphate oxidase family protein [Actinomycetota bacterium]MBU1493511.1 pyridoxamine 5'-phosphate oxidase family protein [Actinomycetota bacterium]MBU1864950.1 pyridoxamine 5'-phosphate oxidase family protein [Actinomycetota bacterium]